MTSVHFWPVACLVTAVMAISDGPARAQAPESQRLAAALEALIATGPSGHTTHDAEEWLQLAVTDAIKRGDRAIERLAVRAASPLRAHITIPVSSTESLPHLDINTQGVLKVARPIGYSAQILVSLDGAEFVKMPEVRSGSTQTLRLDRKLGLSAELPGFHSLRVKAHLTFGGGAENGPASWSEVRDLPEFFYALYDLTTQPTSGSLDLRTFVYGPASVASREFDPQLGNEPFAVWLAGVLSARRTRTTRIRFGGRTTAASEQRKLTRLLCRRPSARSCTFRCAATSGKCGSGREIFAPLTMGSSGSEWHHRGSKGS